VELSIGDLLAEGAWMQEIRQSAMITEMIERDVGPRRQRIAKQCPDRLEQGLERIVQKASATNGT